MSHQAATGTTNSKSNLGKLLREAREAQGISIASAAMQTSLRADTIEKLEQNRFKEIGASVFVRGYLSIYAKFLKLDEEIVRKGYKVSREDTQHLKLAPVNVASQSRALKNSNTRNWLYLILVLLVGGILLQQLLTSDSWLMKRLNSIFAPATPVVDSSSFKLPSDDVGNHAEANEQPDLVMQIAKSAKQEADSQNDVDQHGDDTLSLTAIPPTNSSEKIENIPSNDQPVLQLTSIDSGSSATESAPTLPSSVKPALISTPTVNSVISTKAQKEIVLILTTSAENWVQVNSANGKLIYSRVFKPNESIKLDASGMPYRFNIGRPSTVTLQLYGKTIGLKAFQQKGSQRLFTIGRTHE